MSLRVYHWTLNHNSDILSHDDTVSILYTTHAQDSNSRLDYRKVDVNTRYPAVGMDNGSINLADIKVVPHFTTNDDLAKSIRSKLNSHLNKTNVIGNQPSQGPTFLVFRPSGRAGDEFTEQVTPHLKEGSPQYLIIASSTKPTDTFGISEDDKKRLHRHQTRVVINGGRLVAPHEIYHDYNSDSLKKLVEAICEDYSDFVEMWTSRDSRKANKNPYCLDVMSKALKSGALDKEELLQLSIKVLEEDRKNDERLTRVIPILKQYMDQKTGSPKKKSKASGSEGPRPKAKKEPNAKVLETLDKKLHEHGQSGIKIKWLSIAETDMMMDSIPVKAGNIGKRNYRNETTEQGQFHDDWVSPLEGEISMICIKQYSCQNCGNFIRTDDRFLRCEACKMKQKAINLKRDWRCSLYFKDDADQYSVSSEVMKSCLEEKCSEETADGIEDFLLSCGKMYYITYGDDEKVIGDGD